MVYRTAFRIAPVPPFRLDLTAWVLRRERINMLDRWDGTTYRRVVSQDGLQYEMAVSQEGGMENPMLEVGVSSDKPDDAILEKATAALKCLLGTDADLSAFYHLAGSHRELKPLAERFRGVKPSRFLTIFETLANGFIFQQISLAAGMSVLNRLVENFGAAAPAGAGHAFPSPENIAAASPEMLRSIGLSRQKGKAFSEVASGITGGLNLDQVREMGDEDAAVFLCRMRGVGRWTAQYVLLRGLGRLNIFPGDDVGARNRVKNWLGLENVPDYEVIRSIGASWYPYGGMIYFHLLLNHLAEKGYIVE